MNITNTLRHFAIIMHPSYPTGMRRRLVQESSLVGDYEDAMARPGSSALWIGEEHHLNREEVAELVGHLQRWVDTGSLEEA